MKWLNYLLIFFLFGCSQKYFIDSFTSIQIKSNNPKKVVVGVYEVDIPYYLEEGEIPISDNNTTKYQKIYTRDDYQDILTQRVLTFLHLSFPNGIIGAYPWDFSKKLKNKLKIYIDDIYIKNKKMFLNMRYSYNKKIGRFHIYKKIKSLDKKEIVKEFFKLYDLGLQRVVKIL